MTRYLAVAVLFVGMSASGAPRAACTAPSFCSCRVPRGGAAAARTDAMAVFEGDAIGLRRSGSANEAVLLVRRVWKGSLADSAVVATGLGGGDCGFAFQLGVRYLVYAFKGPGSELRTSICTRTTQLDSAAADIVALGRPSRTR